MIAAKDSLFQISLGHLFFFTMEMRTTKIIAIIAAITMLATPNGRPCSDRAGVGDEIGVGAKSFSGCDEVAVGAGVSSDAGGGAVGAGGVSVARSVAVGAGGAAVDVVVGNAVGGGVRSKVTATESGETHAPHPSALAKGKAFSNRVVSTFSHGISRT